MNFINNQQNQSQSINDMKTGTTTLGLVVKDGVVLAADTRATMGHLKASNKAQKVFKLDDHVGLTIAGSVGDAQRIVRLLRAEINLYNIENNKISVKGVSTLLSNVLNSSKMMPFMNQFVIGGVGDENILYDLDPLGGLMSHRRFTATGSGSPTAYGVLEDAYSEDMFMGDGVKLAIRAVRAASERDIASGDGIKIVKITEEGYEEVPESTVEKHLE